MNDHKQCRIILSLLMGLILLAFCLPVCAFAETSELSDGDEKGISLSTNVPPSIISGAGAVYDASSAGGLAFKTDDAKENLLRVLVDGKVVSPENYTVSGALLAITLHAGYLATLSAGEHTIEIVTVNGTTQAGFTIQKEPGDGAGPDVPSDNPTGESETDAPSANPKTGDDSNIGLWIALMCASGTALVSLIIFGIKRKARSKRWFKLGISETS